MPYIKQERRVELHSVIEEMIKKNVQDNGDLNYLLFYYCIHVLHPDGTQSYNKLKNFIGELNECAAELRRKYMGPYENTKEKENGPIEKIFPRLESYQSLNKVPLDHPHVLFKCADPGIICGNAAGECGCLSPESEWCDYKRPKNE